jgi:hypothetical protein
VREIITDTNKQNLEESDIQLLQTSLQNSMFNPMQDQESKVQKQILFDKFSSETKPPET